MLKDFSFRNPGKRFFIPSVVILFPDKSSSVSFEFHVRARAKVGIQSSVIWQFINDILSRLLFSERALSKVKIYSLPIYMFSKVNFFKNSGLSLKKSAIANTTESELTFYSIYPVSLMLLDLELTSVSTEAGSSTD